MDHHLETQLRAAKVAGRVLARLSGPARAGLVQDVARSVRSASASILDANATDVAAAEASGMPRRLLTVCV